jgi:hypothetical protein
LYVLHLAYKSEDTCVPKGEDTLTQALRGSSVRVEDIFIPSFLKLLSIQLTVEYGITPCWLELL